MSTSSTPPQAPAMGPRQARIEWVWSKAWECLSKGDFHQYWLSQAAADLALYRAQLVPGDAIGADDLKQPENLDRSHREQFLANWERMEGTRKTFQFLRDFMLTNVTKTNNFAFQTLALANGAVALGVLGYMGKEGGGATSRGLILVLVLTSIGFLATLLSAHLATILAQPYIRVLSELSIPYLSEADRAGKIQSMQSKVRWAMWPSRALSYVAAACLIGGVYVGATTLWDTSKVQQHNTSNVGQYLHIQSLKQRS